MGLDTLLWLLGALVLLILLSRSLTGHGSRCEKCYKGLSRRGLKYADVCHHCGHVQGQSL